MDLPLIQGFAFCAWAIENQPMSTVDRRDAGYVAQELARLTRS